MVNDNGVPPAFGALAEWSKAPRSGRGLFGGVGSNPTGTIFLAFFITNNFYHIYHYHKRLHLVEKGWKPGLDCVVYLIFIGL